jgi:hypothetical protein
VSEDMSEALAVMLGLVTQPSGPDPQPASS